MNLLLLLSALLSALGGMEQAVRGVREPQAVCVSVTGCADAVVQGAAATARPAGSLPRADRAPIASFTPQPLFRAEPIFAGRRRE